MSPSPYPEPEVVVSAQQEIVRLAALRQVRSALQWFRSQEAQIARWQLEVAKIPAPPFGESARSKWLEDQFRELELKDVHIDEVGNVLGRRPGMGEQCITLSAHIDTVFPSGTPLNIRQQGSRLYGPGISDNGAGIAALLAIIAALRSAEFPHTLPILFIGNVGEEGEGDLRGMRHIFASERYRNTILSSLVLDGAGTDTVVAEALGSLRFEVIVRGPGGHSWSDFGAPNPILVLARAIQAFSQTPISPSPKTTSNIGVIRGGTSVNSIPESASMRVDIRSTSRQEMERLERALRLALERAIEQESEAFAERTSTQQRKLGLSQTGLSSEVVPIGNRPAGELDSAARILQIIRAVDAHLGNSAQIQRASTDANIPLALGREAITIGGGGTGGGAHTLQEWFDCNGRDLGLKRILLTVLALAGASE
jgi:acetylornithine deacetylase/succinyl-diaminopimelate desuccinylase-like protein